MFLFVTGAIGIIKVCGGYVLAKKLEKCINYSRRSEFLIAILGILIFSMNMPILSLSARQLSHFLMESAYPVRNLLTCLILLLHRYQGCPRFLTGLDSRQTPLQFPWLVSVQVPMLSGCVPSCICTITDLPLPWYASLRLPRGTLARCIWPSTVPGQLASCFVTVPNLPEMSKPK